MVRIKAVKIRDERQLRALLGLPSKAFNKLLNVFSTIFENKKNERYEARKQPKSRTRQPGGGAKGKLPTAQHKLEFILYYYKTYPTFDELAAHFDLSRSNAHQNVHKLSPILHEALSKMKMIPHRNFNSIEEFKTAVDDIDRILIDATERAYRRAKDYDVQREYYSGKKKRHTVKNTIISTEDKFIFFLGQTFTGRSHDYKMLKLEFPPHIHWFEDISVLVDLGYLGINSDYESENIHVPHKKPRKSKNNPNPSLTDEQIEDNKTLSKVRIIVENAIAGIKRYNILVHSFRNRIKDFDDQVIAVSAGLWNLSLPA